MKIISFASFKGGVGKSSLAVNVAGVAARDHGQSVLLVDADENRTSSNWFRGGVEPPYVVTAVDPAVDSLTKLRKARGYDLVVVDLPGHRGQALHDVITDSLADLVLVPARANAADMPTLGRLLPAITGDYRVIFNQTTPGHDPQVDLYRDALDERGWKYAETVVRQSKGWSMAVTESRLVIDGTAFPTARTDARALTNEVMEILR